MTPQPTHLARLHIKADLECQLLRIALAESQADYYRTHPLLNDQEREQTAAHAMRHHARWTQRYELARRAFLAEHGAAPSLARIPTQLRRLIKRLFCRPAALRHPAPKDDTQ